MWKLKKEEQDLQYKYVWNKGGFDAIDPNTDDFVLGNIYTLFTKFIVYTVRSFICVVYNYEFKLF